MFCCRSIVVEIGGFCERENLLLGVCKIIDEDSIILHHILEIVVVNYFYDFCT